MSDIVRVVHLTDALGAGDAVDRLRSAFADLPATRSVVAPTLPGARNGGDVLVRLRFDSAEDHHHVTGRVAAALTGPGVDRVVGATLDLPDLCTDRAGRRDGAGGPGVYRVLLAKVADGTPAEEVARFERALLQMPEHIPHIRAWRLTRAAESVGPTAWTHAWEQEYDDVDGLLGPYMNHPVHWAHVDRWFDPESPLQLVRERVCHTFCAIDESVLPL
ncbi:Dabb family protein [Microbacter sp. ANSKLAB05]|nr:Dabb family protein [Microbacter sp. ANSKLAB05]